MPLENPLTFYPWHWTKSFGNLARLVWAVWRANRLQKRLMADPARYDYTDVSMTPPETDDTATLALFQETSGAEAALQREQVIVKAREKAMAVPDLR